MSKAYVYCLENHIENICWKIISTVFLMKKMSHAVDADRLLKMYYGQRPIFNLCPVLSYTKPIPFSLLITYNIGQGGL